jgi:TrmH family RNA methyltransferase
MAALIITSLHNPRVKDAAKLRDRRERQKQGRILIDGARELLLALQAGIELVEVFVCRPLCRTERARAALDELETRGINLLEVSVDVFEKLAFGDRAEGVLGVASEPRRNLADIVLPENPLVAVLEGIEKPGNLGAVLRSADAAGVAAVVATGTGTDVYNPNAIRASLGTVFTLQVCTAPAVETLSWLRGHHLEIYAARPDATAQYTEQSYRGPTAFVLGGEAAGLSPIWTGQDVTPIKLPMKGAADSLNISVAAAVLFFEALRQRDWKAEGRRQKTEG